ncbi:hypothetical protein ACTFIV_009876 [Dictyostelium citrinum]
MLDKAIKGIFQGGVEVLKAYYDISAPIEEFYVPKKVWGYEIKNETTIHQIRTLLFGFINQLYSRGMNVDVEMFITALSNVIYGEREYWDAVKGIGKTTIFTLKRYERACEIYIGILEILQEDGCEFESIELRSVCPISWWDKKPLGTQQWYCSMCGHRNVLNFFGFYNCGNCDNELDKNSKAVSIRRRDKGASKVKLPVY